MRPALRALVAWALDAEGSTRPAALIRIGLALNLWVRFGAELNFWRAETSLTRVLVIGFYLASSAMLVGLASQWAAAAACVCVLIMGNAWQLLGGPEGWSHHHVFLLGVGTGLIALAPCGRSYSIDRWLALRRVARRGDPAPAERGPQWALRLIVVQLSVIYFFTALDKTHIGFFSGARIQHYFLTYHWGSEPPTNGWWRGVTSVIGCGTIALEYALAVGLPFSRSRRYLIGPGLALHGIFYLLLPILTYTTTVWVLYLAYLDPDRVHRVIDQLSSRPPGSLP